MNNDNTSPLNAKEYDSKISKTIPYYNEFATQVFSLVKRMNYKNISWMDLGCGTGSMAKYASNYFSVDQWVLVDPSENMLDQARLHNLKNVEYICTTSDKIEFTAEFDVITAIQSHHYMKKAEREEATCRIYKALKENGIYISFENVIPESEDLREFELKRWGNYQLSQGKSSQEVEAHMARCGVNYLPITVKEHINVLKKAGFVKVNVFWKSYMQMGIYGVKNKHPYK